MYCYAVLAGDVSKIKRPYADIRHLLLAVLLGDIEFRDSSDEYVKKIMYMSKMWGNISLSRVSFLGRSVSKIYRP